MAHSKDKKSAPEASRTALVRRARDTDGDADERLATETLEQIRRITRRAVIAGAVEIGDLLISRFFGGDLELAASNSPTKDRALSRLMERAPREIDVSAAVLRRAVPLSLQYRALPSAVRDQLSMRQHLALLPVAATQTKRQLAEQALAQNLSGEQIARKVRARGKAKTGRPPLPELERATAAAERALASGAIDGALVAAAIRSLKPEARARIERRVLGLRERIERIADTLRRVKA